MGRNNEAPECNHGAVFPNAPLASPVGEEVFNKDIKTIGTMVAAETHNRESHTSLHGCML